MPINPNIALSAKGIELQDPMVAYGRMAQIQQAQNQNALAQMQLAQAQREQEGTNALNQAYASAFNPTTGSVDVDKLRKSLATGGYGSKLPALEKTLLEAQTAKTTQQKAENDLFDSSMKQIRELWGNVRTLDDALAVHDATHADPVISKRLTSLGVTAQMGRQQIIDAAKDPATFSEFVKRAQLGAEKFIEMNKPQLSTVDLNNEVVTRTFNPVTNQMTELSRTPKGLAPQALKPEKATDGKYEWLTAFDPATGTSKEVPGSRHPVGMTAYEAANTKLARERFEFEKANPGIEVKEQADGSLVGINKRTGKAEPITTGATGQLVMAPSKLTEGQAGATNFGIRMSEADKILSGLEGKGVKDTGLIRTGVSGIAGTVPLIGESLGKGVDNVFNVLPSIMGGLSREQQQIMQARVNFVTAVLRKESGASISPSEFATAEKTYFPAAGDDPETIRQKQQARQTAIRGMKIQAGPGAAEIDKNLSPSSDLPPDIAALVAKHGGKK